MSPLGGATATARHRATHGHRRLAVVAAMLVATALTTLLLAGAAALTGPAVPAADTSGRQLTVTVLLALITLGMNFTFWGIVGLVRWVDERRGAPTSSAPTHPAPTRIARDRIAVVMAAHNEAAVIVDALSALHGLVDASQVYVASDGSTDETSALARGVGVNVLDVTPNRGKAGALRAALTHFDLLDRYEAVLFVDADTHLDPGYLRGALPWLDDPSVVAVAGYAKPLWDPDRQSWTGRLIAAHRHRLYAVTQLLQKYGQTWRLTNVAYIVPGFASMYRSSALRRIDMDPPGLVIEDFNMTFEVHRHRLGRIAFTPQMLARCHEPETFADYVKQVRRWVLGFWQTIRRHGFWPSAFCVALGLWVLEVVLVSIAFLLWPLVVATLAIPAVVPDATTWPLVGTAHTWLQGWVTLPLLLGAVLVPDLVVLSALGLRDRRPLYPLLALGMPLLRVTDAYLGLTTIPRAWTQRSDGTWASPSRAPTRPSPPDAPSDCSEQREVAGRAAVDLNRASVADLQRLGGIGPVLAQRIVAARPFANLDELMRIRGIGPDSIARFRNDGRAVIDPDDRAG